MPCAGQRAGWPMVSTCLSGVPCAVALCHVETSLLQDVGACFIGPLTQRHAGGGQVVELKLRVGVPVGGRALQLKEQVVLRSPHGFAATWGIGIAGHEVGAEEAKDLCRRFGGREDQRDAGTDQVGESKDRADVLIGLEHAIEPDMLIEPKPRFDDVQGLGLPRWCASRFLNFGLCSGEHGAYLCYLIQQLLG
jgi:hypothetical protein